MSVHGALSVLSRNLKLSNNSLEMEDLGIFGSRCTNLRRDGSVAGFSVRYVRRYVPETDVARDHGRWNFDREREGTQIQGAVGYEAALVDAVGCVG